MSSSLPRGALATTGSQRCRRYYIFSGLALSASLLALFTKMRLLLYKLHRRRAPSATFLSSAELEERSDILKQHVTKVLLYLLCACCEVRHAMPVTSPAGDRCVTHTASQDIPFSVLTLLYISELDGPPSTVVLLSFATSLIYLGWVRSSIVANRRVGLASCTCIFVSVQI